jgi:hypothetical protein
VAEDYLKEKEDDLIIKDNEIIFREKMKIKEKWLQQSSKY